MFLLFITNIFAATLCPDGSSVNADGLYGHFACAQQVRWNYCVENAQAKYNNQLHTIDYYIKEAERYINLAEQTKLICLTITDSSRLQICENEVLDTANRATVFIEKAQQLNNSMPDILSEARTCYWAKQIERQREKAVRKQNKQ